VAKILSGTELKMPALDQRSDYGGNRAKYDTSLSYGSGRGGGMLFIFFPYHFHCPMVQFHGQLMPTLLSAVAESGGDLILPIHTHYPVPHSQIVNLVEI